ncbi:transmembrane protein 115 [Parasteatoda tepidariorum]|uniref:transmembrane protein 115 n=1 Tax=Parasteatoda tepidariorum TaxID=114398 RepID=UPI00077F96B8|nr:transmembrane protein 115 [Parasteatoda tepidariorum]
MAPKISISISIIKRNLHYLNQQLAAAFKNSSVVVKFICIVNIFCYFLSFNETAIRVISVTPGFIIPPNFWVWTAFTHCYLETKFYLLLADVITVGLCGKLLEPLWGAMEMLTFFALVNTSVAFLSVMFYIVIFTVTSDPRYLFSVQIHGLAGYCAAVSVAVKQIMPDHVLVTFPCGKLRNRNVPLCVLILSLILWPIGIVGGTYPVMFTSGLLSSWVYLRFYQHHSNGTTGDMADGFTFASFFPNVIQPPLILVSNAVFDFFVHVKLCRKPVHKYNQVPTSVTVTIPGTDPHDAERRRQIALRALSERLSKVESSPWPLIPDVSKYAEKSKSVNLTMPPILSPHQSSTALATNSKPQTAHSDETARITTHPSSEQ